MDLAILVLRLHFECRKALESVCKPRTAALPLPPAWKHERPGIPA